MRKIKVVKCTYDDVAANRSESMVNTEIEKISEKGGKVVSITTNSFGLSPMLMVFTIIYEG